MGPSRANSSVWTVVWVLCLFGALEACGVDCNLNGRDDVTDISEGFSEDCNQNAVPDECEVLPLQFAPRGEALRVALNAITVRVADLDGDGDVDMIAGSLRSGRPSNVSVLLNNGGGDFAAPRDRHGRQRPCRHKTC